MKFAIIILRQKFYSATLKLWIIFGSGQAENAGKYY